MAFQSMTHYNEENYGNRFRLSNDGDYTDVIFLYKSINEVLIGDVHYLKFPEYSGYVHCLGGNCPACNSNVRLQRKIFIPLYLVEQRKVVFWDRTTNFENQLQRDIFSRYADPSKVIFRITRHGAYRDMNTTYDITAVGNNNVMSFEEICRQFNITFPDFYESICESKSFTDLQSLLGGSNTSYAPDTALDFNLPDYQVSPRGAIGDSSDVNTSTDISVSNPTSDVPNTSDVVGGGNASIDISTTPIADGDGDVPF